MSFENARKRRARFMPFQTRENPETGILEILVEDTWVCFEEYRRHKIDDAYENSIKFLRDRLGDDLRKSDQGADDK
jgi:hypothetical protein